MASKDPAFLFYPRDFLAKTYLMSNEERGIYIQLVCLQHENGAINEKHMNNICSSYVEDMKKTMNVNEHGEYYFEWLEESIIKRQKYAESRANNRKGVKTEKKETYEKHMNNICTTCDEHMVNVNVNENIIVNRDINEDIKEGVIGGEKRETSSKPKPKTKTLDLSFVDEKYLSIIEEWISYKKEIKNTYTDRGIKLFYKNLLEYANNNPDNARLIIEKSIANCWKGIIPLKNNFGNSSNFNNTNNFKNYGAGTLLKNPISYDDDGL